MIDQDESIISLADRNGIFAQTKDTVVKTRFGDVTIAAGSAVMLLQHGASLAIFNLHDDHPGAVTFKSGDESHTVEVGKQLVLTQNKDASFADVNKSHIGYRGLTPGTVNNNNAFSAEFSLLSAVTTVEGLFNLLHSNKKEERQLASKILKTAAAMSIIGQNKGVYSTSTK